MPVGTVTVISKWIIPFSTLPTSPYVLWQSGYLPWKSIPGQLKLEGWLQSPDSEMLSRHWWSEVVFRNIFLVSWDSVLNSAYLLPSYQKIYHYSQSNFVPEDLFWFTCLNGLSYLVFWICVFPLSLGAQMSKWVYTQEIGNSIYMGMDTCVTGQSTIWRTASHSCASVFK